MRKLTSGIMLLLCAILYGTSAYAAIDVTGWENSNFQIPSADTDASVDFVQDSTDPAPSGGRGQLYIWTSGKTGTAYLNARGIQRITGLDVTKTYRLTGDVKYSSNETTLELTNAVIASTGSSRVKFVEYFNPILYNSWSELVLDIRPTKANIDLAFQVLANRKMWIDNISFREIIYAEDGVTEIGLGKELVTNGDFEADIDDDPPADVTNVSVESMDSSAKITWTNPKEDFVTAYVYKEGDETPIGSTKDGYILLYGLENNVEHTFIIKAADRVNNLSGGVAVTAKPVPDPLKISDVRFEMGGNQVSELSEGILKTTVALKNNGCAEDFSAELIVVLLKDGALVDISTAYSVIELSDWKEEYTTIAAETEIPSGDGYSVEVYLWSGLGEMTSIVDGRISSL